jgi:L-seryl-tRNA(Ser) seleniumtransferase
LPTKLVAITRAGHSTETLEALLRRRETPVVARIQDDRIVLDLRTVDPADDPMLAELGPE